jgi:hypothetical protein
MPVLKMRSLIAAAVAILAVAAPAGPADALQEAKRVMQALDRIYKESPARTIAPLEKIDFTESELNSYIAYRIASEKEEVMKELRLKLFEQNRIEGKIFLDLTGQKLPLLLSPQMNLYFEGNFEVQNRHIRLDFKKLFLEERQVPLMLLDLIIYVAAKLGKTDSTSINDWYELPIGIKDMRTGPGRVTIYY